MKTLLIIMYLFCLTYTYEKYDRGKHFGHWKDFDKDCQDTRQEVLIEEAIDSLIMDDNGCRVISGIWYDHYSGQLVRDIKVLDVDHVVPLKEAYISGAWSWTKKERELYANYLKDIGHLLAVNNGLNRSKGSKKPNGWLPPNRLYEKEYCRLWVRIKVRWGLTVTYEELKFLQNVLGDEQVIYPRIR